jgi:hypothetical protein
MKRLVVVLTMVLSAISIGALAVGYGQKPEHPVPKSERTPSGTVRYVQPMRMRSAPPVTSPPPIHASQTFRL